MGKPSSGATPQRASNNYAAPNTPIASAKRPRSSMDRSMLSPTGHKSGLPATPLVKDDPKTPGTSSGKGKASAAMTTPPSRKPPLAASAADVEEQTMSPMHKPRPMSVHDLKIKEKLSVHLENEEEDAERKNDELFSPVLHFGSEEEQEGGEKLDGDESAVVTDEDTTTTVKAQPSDTSHTTSVTEATSHNEYEEEEPLYHEEPQIHEDDVEEDVAEEAAHHHDDESDEEDEFNPYLFIKSLPSYELVAPLRPPITLPPKDKNSPPISLVLDLDETLVHCTVEPVDDADLVFPVVFHGMTYQVHVRLRPHLFTFLEKIKGKFEVIVFTASQKVYANELLNLIDPDGKYIQHRLFRESCLAVEGNFLKDLTVLGRDLKKSVLVDNSPHAFGYQVDNGIPIESWFDEPTDTELLKLERFLRSLHDVSDVRKQVRRKFQTYKLVQES
eukprot:CAMPEP_0119556168 /NCGR_PEP_ID=MMETSP1352-20130426/8193_1 /TAXON_ID=265584 /ORGANISM="Stauroneis constricta, Strain CCMP1120" /LENGTH=443 /DNA_ID=CAMNT_0007603071 /DNA_START=359 /DNA_END=1690 /DNA_ORIENTATION=-